MSSGTLEPLTDAQQHLFDAAVDAFAELGFRGTGTRDIAARAHRSPTALYIHHPTKEDLLFAISLRGHRSALECLREAHDRPGTAAARLRGMVHSFSLWHMENARLGRVVQFELGAMTAAHRDEIAVIRGRFQQLMRSVLAAGVEEGAFEVNDAPRAAGALLSLSIDLVRWFEPGRTRGRQAIAREHADLAVRMVRRCPSSHPDADEATGAGR